MASTNEHQKRITVITGGSGGIGAAIATRLHTDGATVHIIDIEQSPPLSGNNSEFHRADVGSETEINSTIDAIGKGAGKIDYLIGCAGIYPRRPFLELSLEEWQRTLQTNLTGSFLCCRAVLRYMRPHKFGRIVLFSSMAARTGAVAGSHYSASKGGILGLARSLSIEVAAENIRVNTISPGITDTPQPRAFLTDADLQARKARIPLGRLGEVRDMVETCLFLLSEESSFMLGQDIRVNGGASLW